MNCQNVIRALTGTILLLCSQALLASTITLDFDTEDDLITPLVNGQDISTPPEFGNFVSLSSSGSNQGLAIFDSNPAGPNAAGPDADLSSCLGSTRRPWWRR